MTAADKDKLDVSIPDEALTEADGRYLRYLMLGTFGQTVHRSTGDDYVLKAKQYTLMASV